MKKILRWFLILSIIGGLIIIKVFYLSKNNGNTNITLTNKNKNIIYANFFVVKTFNLNDQIYTSGVIGAYNQIEIKPELSGKITKIYFKEGENIKMGGNLIKLKDNDLQANLQKLIAQKQLAENKLERLKKLIQIQGVSQEELEIQENTLNTIKADIAYQEAILDKTIITAPFNGYVGLKNFSEGAYVTPNNTIATFVQTKPLYVEFAIPEKYINLIHNGMNIHFYINTNDKQNKLNAKIYAIDPHLDEATRTIKVRANYDGNDKLFIGSFVKVYVDLKMSPKALMIPTHALVPALKGNKVFIANNGEIKEVYIQSGIRTNDKIEVIDGLNIGDTILTNGFMSIKKDSKINFLKEEE